MPDQLQLFLPEPPFRRGPGDPGYSSIPVNVFFAILPDGDTAQFIVERCEALAANFALKGKLRKPEILHISLQALGSMNDLSDYYIDRAISLAAKLPHRSFPVVFDRIATFRGKSQAKPLVLCEQDGNDSLKAFYQQLRIEFRATPWALNSRFTPHMTFMYGQAFAGEHLIESLQWRAAEFALIASYVGEQRYERLASWPLLDDADEF